MNDPIELELPKPEARDPNKTYYKIIEHKNSNRRKYERFQMFLKGNPNPTTISRQVVRDGPRPVDVKRLERARKRALKLESSRDPNRF